MLLCGMFFGVNCIFFMYSTMCGLVSRELTLTDWFPFVDVACNCLSKIARAALNCTHRKLITLICSVIQHENRDNKYFMLEAAIQLI